MDTTSNPSAPEKQHENMDAFLGAVLYDYKSTETATEVAVAGPIRVAAESEARDGCADQASCKLE